MSATTPTSPTNEEDEIHDLVLLFANSKIPRGSDAFQTLVGDFLKRESPDSAAEDNIPSSNSSDSSVKEVETDLKVLQPPKSSLKSNRKSVRVVSPSAKQLAHVHWPDDHHTPKLPQEPLAEPTHHARLYMKTTPKPILKHDEHVMVRSANSRQRRRVNTPTL